MHHLDIDQHALKRGLWKFDFDHNLFYNVQSGDNSHKQTNNNMLKAKIQQDLISSLKEKKAAELETLRFFMAEVKNLEIEKKAELSDEEVIKILKKQIKNLSDAVEMFTKGGRKDLVDQNDQQIKILSQYLPAELSDEELEAAIKTLIEDNKETYEKNPKMIIGIAMKQLSPQADPKRIIAELNNK